MRRLYTRTGDEGTTGINGGLRLPKDDIRIEANGCLDELNAMLGIVRSMMKVDDSRSDRLQQIQTWLMVCMSHVATLSDQRPQNPNPLPEAMDAYCEQWMDEVMPMLGDSSFFVLPGGTLVSAHMQYARTLARRAERRLWTLHRQDPLPRQILLFMNRLSDLLFVLARQEMMLAGCEEERWRKFRVAKNDR